MLKPGKSIRKCGRLLARSRHTWVIPQGFLVRARPRFSLQISLSRTDVTEGSRGNKDVAHQACLGAPPAYSQTHCFVSHGPCELGIAEPVINTEATSQPAGRPVGITSPVLQTGRN